MRISVALPTTGPTASPDSILRAARHADNVGLDRLWTVDRLLRPADGTAYIDEHYKITYDPIESLVWAAAHTDRIGLGTSIVLVPFQNPVVLARRLATLDRFSGGRTLIGLGSGHMPQEFETTGVPSRQRAKRLEEGIMAMRAVWGPDPVSFAGAFTTIPLSDIGPKPLSPQGPPLLLGGWADAAIRRAGRLGLGINLILDALPTLHRQIQLWRQAAEEAGHSPDELDVVVRTNLAVGEHRDRTKLGIAAWPLADLVGDLRELSAIGVTEIFYELHEAAAPVEQLIDDLAAVRAEVTT